MPISTRIEQSLERAIAQAQVPGAPPRLAAALHYSVFPGGHRIRPQLCLAVARACGDSDPQAARRLLRRLNCSTAHHSSTTTCRVSTMRTCVGESLPFMWSSERRLRFWPETP